MITRGFYLGQIIDELASIGAQIKMRNALGLTDLTIFAENFFRDLLNILLQARLENLNKDRSNEPGLDLGDETSGWGIQVTSTAGSSKVNDTLKAITAEQTKRYTKIVVLVLGTKQPDYSLDEKLATSFNFTKKKCIWDLNTLARKALALELRELQALHQVVVDEVAKLKVELEVPDADGKFPTNGFDKWEKRVKPGIGAGKVFRAFFIKEYGIDQDQLTELSTRSQLEEVCRRLSCLPRVTREFLAMLYERREMGSSKRFKDAWIHLLYDKVEREYRGGDMKTELDILEHADFVRLDHDDPRDYGPPEIGVRLSLKSEELSDGFLEFIQRKKLDLRKVIGQVDFSAF